MHYSTFKNTSSQYYKQFRIDGFILTQLEKKFGTEQKFIASDCQSINCVTFLSGHYIDTAFIENHIQELHLYANVFWFGDKLDEAIDWLLENVYQNHSRHYRKSMKFAVLHWTPSEIINAKVEYKALTMPRCEEMQTTQTTLCKYELTPLYKYYSVALRDANKAHFALDKFYVEQYDLYRMLSDIKDLRINSTESSEAEIYDRVACSWLHDNRKTYSEWLIKDKMELLIGGIFPFTGTGDAYKNLEPAAQKAVEAVNANSTILPNVKLRIRISDGQCRSDIVMKYFIHYFNLLTENPFLGVLGPACSETVEPIAGISKHVRMPVVSYSAEGATFTDRANYPYFFRTIGSNRQYEAVYVKLMQHLKWKRVAALTEDGQKYTDYIPHLETQLKQFNMELILNKKFPKDISTAEMRRHLLDMKRKNAKIIIGDIYNDIAQVVMCEAYHLKMTSKDGYVWFLPVWLSKIWIVNNELKLMQNVSCTAEQLYTAINGHFSLAHSAFASNDTIMQENRNVSQWLDDFSKTVNSTELSDYTGFAYDAVWVYALAADKLLREDPSATDDLRAPDVVNRFVDIIWKTDFNGVSGRIRFGEGGSRISTINILQWAYGQFRKIGQYVPHVDEKGFKIIGGNLELNESKIVWLQNHEKPTDGAFVCKMQALADLLDTDCDNVTLIIITISCLLFVTIVSMASFMFWKRQYDMKLKQSAKVMKNFGIDLLSPSANMTNTLDKWEIPKEKVVINRRLGEGAFGTVYGGEAQFNDGGWTAVAVKTLKSGASTEDRLDFLSEAEAMKRFDHKNIIKLLGVCLQSEPIYTIMEFMLYGDLKTFLLARRHLVYEKTTEDSDISPKRLTMMALDVVRGLSYLADMKYVHRDIACRNCLVNAQKVVKLGDFGMARPMFESDYYRFNRKGMLPVRWMAPESLALGVFTPASDVWSFGVLLYEIITFGSFPYQGLTNNEVLDYIKNGKTIQIPAGIKPHLEGLMKACWSQDYKKRPSPSEIVEYISNYPRLLTPCLDVPISSVEMPETESDQMELLPRLRKRINSGQQTLDILTRSAAINNFDQPTANDIRPPENSISVKNLNVPPDSMSTDDTNINIYSPMEPLLRSNPEVSSSNLSLKRYVPMYVIGKKASNSPKNSPKNSPIDIENPCQDNTIL
ncbi:atrial natriuretic peptide receptor 2-like isoform X2 [Hermetia illucens]|nr:atrial natriuretic peptide receptor 2-like isoform X2 [Hermetia illucens]